MYICIYMYMYIITNPSIHSLYKLSSTSFIPIIWRGGLPSKGGVTGLDGFTSILSCCTETTLFRGDFLGLHLCVCECPCVRV